MNEDANRKQCKICHGYLFEDDDIVVCPVCGAPHHRDCWNTVGHCGLEELHGTEDQYDRKKETASEDSNDRQTKVCSYCGRESHSSDASYCPYCGQAYNRATQRNGNFFGTGGFTFDIYGGLDPNTEIEDKVTVNEAAKFVGSNSPRYMHKFVTLNKEHKRSWNWAAFLFPAVWSFTRKMYANGILYLILSVASELCVIPFNTVLNNNLGNSFTSIEAADFIMKSMSEIGALPIILLFVGFVLSIVPMIVCGMTADWVYRSHTLKKIREIKGNDDIDDTDEEISATGNISILWLFISLLATTYIPQLLISLLI